MYKSVSARLYNGYLFKKLTFSLDKIANINFNKV